MVCVRKFLDPYGLAPSVGAAWRFEAEDRDCRGLSRFQTKTAWALRPSRCGELSILDESHRIAAIAQAFSPVLPFPDGSMALPVSTGFPGR